MQLLLLKAVSNPESAAHPEDPVGRHNLAGAFGRGGAAEPQREISFHVLGNCPSMAGLFRKILGSTHCIQSLLSWLHFQTFHMLLCCRYLLSVCHIRFLVAALQFASHSVCRHSFKEIFWHLFYFSESWQAISSQYFSVLPGTCVVRTHMICTALCFLWLSVQWSWKEAVCCWFLGVERLALTVQHLWGICLWNTLSSAELSLKIKYVKS